MAQELAAATYGFLLDLPLPAAGVGGSWRIYARSAIGHEVAGTQQPLGPWYVGDKIEGLGLPSATVLDARPFSVTAFAHKKRIIFLFIFNFILNEQNAKFLF